MTGRDKRLEKAQMRVLFQVPFFAPGVAKLPVVWDSTIETACTAGDNIRWNPEFFDKLKDQELVTVLCHEVCHCLLGHIWRAPGGADWDVWNQATDHAVNLMLKDFGDKVMANRLADPFPFPVDFPPLADPQFAGLAEEVIYQRLSAGRPPGGSGGNQTRPEGGQGQQGAKAAPGGAKLGQIQPGKGDPSVQKKDKANWDATLVQCCQIAKGRGELPGAMDRFVGELFDPTVPWWELVRQWLREQAADDWDFMKPNRLYDDAEFILPSLHSERMGPIVFATDTSGSIDHVMLARFHVEKQNCLDDMKPSALLDICCDSKIQRVTEYRPGETIDPKAPGGGGTDFRPVFDHVDKLPVPPKAVVYLTDLDGTFPDREPDYPVLWVTWEKDGKAPFGTVIAS